MLPTDVAGNPKTFGQLFEANKKTQEHNSALFFKIFLLTIYFSLKALFQISVKMLPVIHALLTALPVL